MRFTVIIPARYASTRLPGKPLLDLAGKTMLQRVYEQACQSGAERVVIATDDQRIYQATENFSAPVYMTAESHPSGTDRLQEVTAQLDCKDEDIIVNVQGDEPLIPPQVIDQVAKLLAADSAAGMATLSEDIEEANDLFDPNVVKVVTDINDNALYFSRAPIPWLRDKGLRDFAESATPQQLLEFGPFRRHIGIYAYRVSFLNQFVSWGAAPMELTEALEQLRALWHGVRIKVAVAEQTPPPGIDTAADLERVRILLQS